MAFHRVTDNDLPILHPHRRSTPRARLGARPIDLVLQGGIPQRVERGIHRRLVLQQFAHLATRRHKPLVRSDETVVVIDHVPRVPLMAPLQGREAVQVVVRHDDVGVAPAIERVGGPRLAVEVVGHTPGESHLFEADHQPAMRAIGEEYHTLQGVVAEIVADMVDWVDVMGQGSAATRRGRLVFLAGREEHRSEGEEQKQAFHGDDFVQKYELINNADNEKHYFCPNKKSMIR